MKRRLAHIEEVTELRPIIGADRIEMAQILGWHVIVRKGEFKPGDRCVYIEIDSKVPEEDERFKFLEAKNYRVRTMKMRGVLSQGLALPITQFPECAKKEIGADVTNILHITKIITAEEKRLAAEENAVEIAREARTKYRLRKLLKTRFGRSLRYNKFTWSILKRIFGGKRAKKTTFPDWIEKTDEERIQNLPEYCNLTIPLYATEKVDGTSSTFAVRRKDKESDKFEFIVCSRNVRQVDMRQKNFHTEDLGGNVYWEIALKCDMERKLREIALLNDATSVVLQGEILGAGLQGNRYGFEGHEFYGYTLVIDGKRQDAQLACDIAHSFDLNWVPILDNNFHMLPTVDAMLEYAEGQSKLYDGPREGIVFRAVEDPLFSFKAVANSFLLEKHPDVLARDMARNAEEEVEEDE